MNPLSATELCKAVDDVAEPVLTWVVPEGRIELSGPVARRWIAKTDNFLASELPYGGERFCVLLPTHWRYPFWLIAPWLRGMELVSTEEATDTDLVVSDDLDFLRATAEEGGADTLVAQSTDSMVTSWGANLPPELLDGIADVMTHGDFVEDPKRARGNAKLVADSVEWVPPELWSHPEDQNLPISSLRSLDYLGDVRDAKSGQLIAPRQLAEALDGARVLVRTANPVLATAQLVQLWLAGARVIWAPDAGTDQHLIDQEAPDLEVA